MMICRFCAGVDLFEVRENCVDPIAVQRDSNSSDSWSRVCLKTTENEANGKKN